MGRRPQDLSSGARRVMRGPNLRVSRHVGRRSGPFINFCFNGEKIPLLGRSSSKAPDGSLWREWMHTGVHAPPQRLASNQNSCSRSRRFSRGLPAIIAPVTSVTICGMNDLTSLNVLPSRAQRPDHQVRAPLCLLAPHLRRFIKAGAGRVTRDLGFRIKWRGNGTRQASDGLLAWNDEGGPNEGNSLAGTSAGKPAERHASPIPRTLRRSRFSGARVAESRRVAPPGHSRLPCRPFRGRRS